MAAGSRWLVGVGGGLLALLAVLAATGGCTQGAPEASRSDAAPTPAPPLAAQTTRLPGADTTVLGGADAALSIAASQALFSHADTVVLSDPDSVSIADAIAPRLGAPTLLVPVADPLASSSPAPSSSTDSGDAALLLELDRLGATTAVVVGADATTWATTNRAAVGIRRIVSSLAASLLPSTRPAPPLDRLSVLVLPGASAARATAAAAGAEVIELHGPDPRADAADIRSLSGRRLDQVLALGGAFGSPDDLRYRVEVAASGVQLPGGGQLLFPGRHFVALYGHPGTPVLGVLGEQGIDASIDRAKALAAEYQTAYGEPVIPTFEIITTIASARAGADGDYSDETSIDTLRPWIEAAQAAGVYVVLDLQPGRTDFLTQAMRYEALLEYPNVGLALDPEWRLGPNQFHLRNVGHVDAAEVNAVGAWLESVAEAHRLPQKVFMIHQWLRSMLSDREQLVTDYAALAVVIHVDGFGGQGSKQQTWNAIRAGAPAGVSWGWKNFIDEDRPMLTPEQTVAEVQPAPVFISYQ